jgi:uncharacterized protein YciI
MTKYVAVYENMQADAASPDMMESLMRNHVEHMRALHSQGVLFMCGPLKSNDHKGLLIFEAGSLEETESYVLKDPLIVHKCYASYHIYEWIVANEENNYLL